MDLITPARTCDMSICHDSSDASCVFGTLGELTLEFIATAL